MQEFSVLAATIGSIVAAVVALVGMRRSGPRSQSALKTDLEILKLVKRTDPHYSRIEANIQSTIRKIYPPHKLHSVPDILVGYVSFFAGVFGALYFAFGNSLWAIPFVLLCVFGYWGVQVGLNPALEQERKKFWKSMSKANQRNLTSRSRPTR